MHARVLRELADGESYLSPVICIHQEHPAIVEAKVLVSAAAMKPDVDLCDHSCLQINGSYG